MTSTDTTAEPRRCLSCRHLISSAESLATGYGAGCRAKIRKAARTADLSEWTPRQLEDARELIEDGGVVPTARPSVFRTVSSDGSAVYLTSARFCGCANGLKASQPRPCYHRLAVTLVHAASARATRLAPAPVAVSAPAPAPRDLIAELEAMVEFELAHA